MLSRGNGIMIIGIDVSTRDIAITWLYDNGRLNHIEKFSLPFKEKGIAETLTYLDFQIGKLAYYYKDQPIVYVENAVYGFNNHLADVVYDVVMEVLCKLGNEPNPLLFHSVVSPNEWKKALGFPITKKGDPKLTPKQKEARMTAFCKEKWPDIDWDVIDNDNKDAFCIAMGGAIRDGLIKDSK